MIKEEFYYDSRDGKSKLHAVRYMPDTDTDIRCVVQIVHGMAEYIERYEEFAEFLTERGCIVTGEDHMGHGKSVGKTQKYGYFCEQDPATVLVRDVHRLKKTTQALYPLLKVSKAVAGMQKVFCGPKHVSGLIDKLAFGSYNKQIQNPATSFDWLSRDAERVEKYISDPMCGFVFTANGFATLFELISRLNKRENLERIPVSLPVLMVSGDADPVGDYGRGVRKAYESLQEAGLENITLTLYEGGRHELINETNRDEVMRDIFRWIEEEVLNGGRSEQQV